VVEDNDADAPPIMDDMADASFMIRPMEVDRVEFTDAGFASAADFEPGHFDDPEEEELRAERIVAAPSNPLPAEMQANAGPSTCPPTHDDIQASLATVGEQLQALLLNDAARRLEIDEVRQEGLVNRSRLDDTQLAIKEVQEMYTSLSQDHDQTKAQLQAALTQLSDLIRFLSTGHAIDPASRTRQAGLTYFTSNPHAPNLRQLAEEIFPDVFSNPSTSIAPHRFDSASHSSPAFLPLANRPMIRRASSNMLPQRQIASSISGANIHRAATGTMKAAEGTPKEKGRGSGKGKSRGKGKGRQKVKGEGMGRGKGKAREEDVDEDAAVDEDEDTAGDEDQDTAGDEEDDD